MEQLNKLAEIVVKFETGAFIGGEQYGHMCLVVLQPKYIETIMNYTWSYAAPNHPGVFNVALTNTMSNVTQ